MLSVVVPTYNEAGSVPILAERLHAALGARDWELVVVDDGSPDGTADIADALAPRIPVRVVRRSGKAGLASAVVAGFAAARGDVLLVMDADLSHPPEVVPALADAVAASSSVAARSSRSAISIRCAVMGNALVPVRDATSGFFALRRTVIDGVKLNPIGFKIGFEVIARGRYTKVVEVPYTFRDRELGASKFGRREILQYIQQLGQVARDKILRRI